MDGCINASIEIVTQTLLTAAGCMLKPVKGGRARQNTLSCFDKECRNVKENARKCLRRFRNSTDSNDLVVYKSQRKEYKRLLQKKKYDQQNARVDILLISVNN